MSAKYATGARVRIRAGEWLRLSFHSEVWKYENLTGEIVSSTPVVGYVIRTWAPDVTRPAQVIQAYKVRLDVGVELDDILEEYLEGLTEVV